jgi:hypothetical protein
MSHAEYAPKQLPVLTRLATALRRIPVVEFAFAKFKSLLRGRTTTEPAVTSEFRSPAADVTQDDVAPGTAEADTVEADIGQADPVGTDVAADRVDIGAVEPDVAATDLIQSETVDTDTAEIDAVGTVRSGLEDVATPVAEPEGLSEEATGIAETDTLPVESCDADKIEIDAAETTAAAIESTETATAELVAVRTDDVAAPQANPAEPSEQDAGESAPLPLDFAETDLIEVEAAETAPFELEAAETNTFENDAVETAAARVDDVATSDVTPDELTEREVDCVGTDTPTATAVETAVIRADLVEADAVETAPAETIIAKADIAATIVAKTDDLCDREALVRRRWRETGIRMWNPKVHGGGHSALCIQGRVALLPPKPGESMPVYDRLEFKLIDGLIVCEGFVVDPTGQPKQRSFASVPTG